MMCLFPPCSPPCSLPPSRTTFKMEGSSASVNSQVIKSGKRKWTVNANTPTLGDVSRAHLSPREESESASLGRKKKKIESDFSAIFEAVNTMTVDIKEACLILSKSIHSDIVQEKFLELPGALRSVDGITSAEARMAIQKFGNHPNKVLLFFGTDPNYRLEMVHDFLANQ
ncbi:hypothetical protein CDL15_Pgr012958 [Punica granatum]|uniref:Uncharacterized protein n=1 Tax=Punica granatum TaxID=22663 RepID=A0A218XEV7_PUNGR|nr:hypothetical protein CDL15_Pgr012958 [Punica granatum]